MCLAVVCVGSNFSHIQSHIKINNINAHIEMCFALVGNKELCKKALALIVVIWLLAIVPVATCS